MVYGGGGITPDVFTPRDSTGINPYYLRLLRSGTLQHFAFTYADRHRARLLSLGSDEAIISALRDQGDQIVGAYVQYASTQGIAQRPGYLQESLLLLRRDLLPLIADMLGADRNLYFKLRNLKDTEVLTALERLERADWRPKK